MSSSIDQLTLREKLRDAARVLHELTEHLELGFVPKVHEIRRLSRTHDRSSEVVPATDATIRTGVTAVLESDRFTSGLLETLDKYLNSIQIDVSNVLSRGTKG